MGNEGDVVENFHFIRNRCTAMTNRAPANTVISTYAYTLDGVGNKTQTDLNEPMMPSYNAETINNYTYFLGNILNTADGNTYTHDANGNRTSKTTGTNVTNYTYDSLNRLTQVAASSRQIQYIYNGLGQRIGKTDNGVQTSYLIDPNGILPQVLAETDTSNNLIAFYVYDGAGLVAKVTPSNQYYFYHYDGLGSTIAITDNTGQVVNSYCYSPEGLVGAQESIPNAFQYVGRFGVMAEGNGLYFMQARYYDPEVGRFINKDPIGYMGGINLFTYVGNNPANLVDPLGLWTYSLGVTVNAGLGLGGGGGTFLNIGHNPNSSWLSGWSFSITGLAGGGATAGAGYGLGIATTITNACDTKQLLGPFYPEVGRGGLGRAGVMYIQSPDRTVQGVNVTVGIRGKGYIGASIGGSTSSALIQWTQGQGFSFGVTPNGAIIP